MESTELSTQIAVLKGFIISEFHQVRLHANPIGKDIG